MDLNHPCVLVVDDLADAADSMAEVLNLCGFECKAHYCCESALASARSIRPAIVILDLLMPRMNGFEFVRRLREVEGCRETAIVIITGYTSLEARNIARELGIGHFLLKPVDLGPLLMVMQDLLHGVKLRFPSLEPSQWEDGGDFVPAALLVAIC